MIAVRTNVDAPRIPPIAPIARSKIALYVALFCVFVIVYASLQPFVGWSSSTKKALSFLSELSQSVTQADVAFNVAAYIPLGFALYAAFSSTWRAWSRWLAVLLLALCLSLVVEMLQTWLPTRVSSIYDIASNVLGTCIGAALAAQIVRQNALVGYLDRLRHSLFIAGATGDLKILLLMIWLIVQINPGIPLFAATFHPGMDAAFEPAMIAVELAQTCAALVGIGLFTDLAMRKRWLGGIALIVVIVAAVGLKTVAAHWLLTPIAWERWLRPGHTLGVALGAVALMVLFWLPRMAKSVIAGIALLSSVMIPFLLPDLVVIRAPLSQFEWGYGQLLNLNGLTRTIVVLWPFIATAVLLLRFGSESKRSDLNKNAKQIKPRA
jgi:VanZ family protein